MYSDRTRLATHAASRLDRGAGDGKVAAPAGPREIRPGAHPDKPIDACTAPGTARLAYDALHLHHLERRRGQTRQARKVDYLVKPITAHDILEGDIPDTGYVVMVEQLPPNFPYWESAWENDDRAIDVVNTSGSVWCRVWESGKDVQIAYAIFAADADVVRCNDVHVDAGHRRRGIADYLYHLAACIFAASVVPSSRLLADGEKFWSGRTSIG